MATRIGPSPNVLRLETLSQYAKFYLLTTASIIVTVPIALSALAIGGGHMLQHATLFGVQAHSVSAVGTVSGFWRAFLHI